MRNVCAALIPLFLSISLVGQAVTSAPAATSQRSTPMPPDKALALSQKYAGEYLAGKMSALWPKLSPKMQEVLKSEADGKVTLDAAFEQIGHESRMYNERVMPVLSTNLMMYTRLSDFEKVPMKLVTTFIVDPAGSITGMSIRPVANPAESKYLDYKPNVQLRFPLVGEWTIFQGGSSVYDNYHAAYSDERFAYDIVVIHTDGRSNAGEGTKPEDYFSFGQPVVAVVAGKVVSAVDQYDDNPINKPLKDSPKQGNSVVIDDGKGEFCMYAHLKRGSIKVKSGDQVKAGQEIGVVGNSGNSPVPHLHFHMQTTPDWFKGDGLPTPFQNIIVNGKKLAFAEPVRADVVKAE